MALSKKPVYALSADPITYGHINIIERAVAMFGSLVVAIGDNPRKQYVFKKEERVALTKKALYPKFQGAVEVASFDGLLVDYAYQNNISTIIRGIRGPEDARFEKNLQDVNKSQQLGIDACFLYADKEKAHISSSAVRELLHNTGDIVGYVPLCVKQALEVRLKNRNVIGLTGEIGAGKSHIAKILKESYPSINNIEVDQIGRDILSQRDAPLFYALRQDLLKAIPELKSAIIDAKNIFFNPKILGNIIFGSTDLLNIFNKLTYDVFLWCIKKEINKTSGFAVINSALLVESSLLPYCNNNVIIVSANDDLRIKRLRERNYSDAQIQMRMSSQLSTDVKRSYIKSAIQKDNFGEYWEIRNDDLPTKEIAETLVSILRGANGSEFSLISFPQAKSES